MKTMETQIQRMVRQRDELLHERDFWKTKCIEARRVARVLASLIVAPQYLIPSEKAALETALAYPEQDSTKET